METTGKLDPEFKAKFLAELRSGKHKQAKKTMYDPASDSLCCLGVACIVVGMEKSELIGVDILCQQETHAGDNSNKWAASEKARHLGYPSILITSPDNDIAVTLAELNDSGSTFSEIADYIEQNL